MHAGNWLMADLGGIFEESWQRVYDYFFYHGLLRRNKVRNGNNTIKRLESQLGPILTQLISIHNTWLLKGVIVYIFVVVHRWWIFALWI